MRSSTVEISMDGHAVGTRHRFDDMGFEGGRPTAGAEASGHFLVVLAVWKAWALFSHSQPIVLAHRIDARHSSRNVVWPSRLLRCIQGSSTRLPCVRSSPCQSRSWNASCASDRYGGKDGGATHESPFGVTQRAFDVLVRDGPAVAKFQKALVGLNPRGVRCSRVR